MPRPSRGARFARALLSTALLLAAVAAAQPDLAPRALEPEELDQTTVERIALRYELDRLAYDVLERSGVPGLVVGVAVAGEVVAAEAYGTADIASGRALTLDDPLWLASVTKPLTAIVVLDLVADGVLSLDDELGRWLPTLTVGPAPGGGDAPITIRHLLTHTAGLDDRLLGTFRPDLQSNPPLAERFADGLPPRVRLPGERASYCNACYALLGMIVEAATDQDVERAYAQRLFAPLGLDSGRLLKPASSEYEAATARPHDRDPGGITPIDIGIVTDPTAGQARLSGADALRLAAELTAPEAVAPLDRGVRDALLSPAHREHPALPGMTLGMAEGTMLGHPIVSQGGDIPGAHGLLMVVPSAALALFVHVNGESDPARPIASADGIVDLRWALAEELLALLLGDAREPPVASAPPTGHAAPVAGPYRLDQYPRTSIEKLLTLTALVQVPLAVEPDGAVAVRAPEQMSRERRYLPTADGVYRRDVGGDALVAARDAGGRPILHGYLGMPRTFELVPWLERLPVVAASVSAFALLAVVVLLAWPVGALARLRRRAPRGDDPPWALRLAHALARAMSFSGLALVLLVGWMVVEAAEFLRPPGDAFLGATLIALVGLLLFTVAHAGTVVAGLVGGRTERWRWALQAVFSLSALALLLQAWVWNITPWS
jgi:CubicO group peptidase (beta-lactamase class C family)